MLFYTFMSLSRILQDIVLFRTSVGDALRKHSVARIFWDLIPFN
jgi:hypothetical protein